MKREDLMKSKFANGGVEVENAYGWRHRREYVFYITGVGGLFDMVLSIFE